MIPKGPRSPQVRGHRPRALAAQDGPAERAGQVRRCDGADAVQWRDFGNLALRRRVLLPEPVGEQGSPAAIVDRPGLLPDRPHALHSPSRRLRLCPRQAPRVRQSLPRQRGQDRDGGRRDGRAGAADRLPVGRPRATDRHARQGGGVCPVSADPGLGAGPTHPQRSLPLCRGKGPACRPEGQWPGGESCATGGWIRASRAALAGRGRGRA